MAVVVRYLNRPLDRQQPDTPCGKQTDMKQQALQKECTVLGDLHREAPVHHCQGCDPALAGGSGSAVAAGVLVVCWRCWV